MLVQTRTIIVKQGFAEQIVQRFSQDIPVDGMEGLIDRTVMVNRKKQDHEEVVMMIRWESLEAWKNWEKSDVHLQGHRDKKAKPAEDHIIEVKVSMYEVAFIKAGTGE